MLAVALVKILLFALSVLIVSKLIPSKVKVDSFFTAVVVALVYGFLNFLAYTLFGILSLPFAYLTLGLGFLIINTLLLLITDKAVKGFEIAGIFWAAIASLLIALCNIVLIKIYNALAGSAPLI